jgi:hypothetical protein
MLGVLIDFGVNNAITSTQPYVEGVWNDYALPVWVYAKPILLGLFFLILLYKWFFSHKD